MWVVVFLRSYWKLEKHGQPQYKHIVTFKQEIGPKYRSADEATNKTETLLNRQVTESGWTDQETGKNKQTKRTWQN